MIRALIVVVGLALAASAFAQSNSAPEGKRPARVALAEKLGLSGAQDTQVKAILKASRQQTKAFRTELQKTTDRKAKRAIREKMQMARADTRQKLSQVLSAEQLRKYDAMRPTPPRRSQTRAA
jgi:NH3-dependent NAD+ synthetase